MTQELEAKTQKLEKKLQENGTENKLLKDLLKGVHGNVGGSQLSRKVSNDQKQWLTFATLRKAFETKTRRWVKLTYSVEKGRDSSPFPKISHEKYHHSR